MLDIGCSGTEYSSSSSSSDGGGGIIIIISSSSSSSSRDAENYIMKSFITCILLQA
jgi:hypothetical protein